MTEDEILSAAAQNNRLRAFSEVDRRLSLEQIQGLKMEVADAMERKGGLFTGGGGRMDFDAYIFTAAELVAFVDGVRGVKAPATDA